MRIEDRTMEEIAFSAINDGSKEPTRNRRQLSLEAEQPENVGGNLTAHFEVAAVVITQATDDALKTLRMQHSNLGYSSMQALLEAASAATGKIALREIASGNDAASVREKCKTSIMARIRKVAALMHAIGGAFNTLTTGTSPAIGYDSQRGIALMDPGQVNRQNLTLVVTEVHAELVDTMMRNGTEFPPKRIIFTVFEAARKLGIPVLTANK